MSETQGEAHDGTLYVEYEADFTIEIQESSKNARYSDAEKYLLFEHDEFTMKPIWMATGGSFPERIIASPHSTVMVRILLSPA